MKNTGNIHIGTSGWNYKHWSGPFYPEKLAQKKWLKFYSDRFSTVEINNSFYRLPDKQTFLTWKQTVPDNFIFSVKGSRYITHMKKLKDPGGPVKNFMQNVRHLQEKLGPVLFQLPPRWKFNQGRLKNFLEILPDGRYTFEFRDQSWWNEQTCQILENYNAAFCIFERAGVLTPKNITADFAYIRLHGPGEAYQGRYDDQTLAGWAGAMTTWKKSVKTVYCYFDNDQNGYAAENAKRLNDMVNKNEK